MNKGKENLAAFAFLIPSAAGVLLFYIVPFGMSFKYALSDSGGSYVGFANFIRLFNNQPFQLASFNTAKFMAASIPLNIIIPLLIGTALHGMRNNGWLKTLFLSPLVIPSACTAFFFQSIFASNGLLSQMLGVTTGWLQTEASFAIAVGAYIWKNLGYNLVLVLAGHANIPPDYYEWARVEGMGRVRMFFRITLVYLTPSLFIMFVMAFINSFKVYRELYMLAGTYPHEKIYMLQHYMNNQFSSLNYQILTSASFVIIALISVFVTAFFIKDRKTETGEA
jgi:multiple sugar transport system permease protein